MSPPQLQTTAYQFLDMAPNEALRRNLANTCASLQLTGTITLAPEGINLSLSGSQAAIAAAEQKLLEESPFKELRFRHSRASQPPFSKLVVRMRPSLLPVSMEQPVAQRRPAAHLSPQQLCQWLDEERPLRLLDVRNVYETHLGRFDQAVTLPLRQFRDFQELSERLTPDELPLVTYCTGGIRCELASDWLQSQGHPHVWQLSGGILNYFEQCGSRHWQGECFVFDNRLAVDPQMRATYPKLCRTCQKPIAQMRQERCVYCETSSLGTD